MLALPSIAVSSDPSPAVVDTSSWNESGSDCTIPELALMLTAKSSGGYIPPAPHADLFTHTTVNDKKLATPKIQSRREGEGE